MRKNGRNLPSDTPENMRGITGTRAYKSAVEPIRVTRTRFSEPILSLTAPQNATARIVTLEVNAFIVPESEAVNPVFL